MATSDITIRGAGIFGLSIAWACVKRGARVTVVDPNGVGAGSSGGVVGALAPHVPENWNPKKAFQLDSLLMAQSFWREVEEVGGLSAGYGRTGRLQPIADDKALALAHRRAGTALELWENKAVWEVVPAAEIEGWGPESPTGFVIRDTLSARLHPARSCAALAQAIHAKGGLIVTEAPDQGAVCWATGVHDLARISTALDRPVGNGVKGQAAVLGFDAGPDAPQLFVDTVHVIPHADGTTAIGSTSEREAVGLDTDSQLEDLIERVRSALPILRDAPVLQRWAGHRPRSKSRAPVLGAHPLDQTQFIANGGFKIGFGMAPKVAEVMADLMLDGRDAVPDAFRSDLSI